MLYTIFKSYFLGLFFVFFPLVQVFCQESKEYVIQGLDDKVLLNDYTDFFLDSTNLYPHPQQLLYKPELFIAYHPALLSVFWHTPYWFKIRIKNMMPEQTEFYFKVPFFDVIEYYIIDENDKITHKQAGEGLMHTERNFPRNTSAIVLGIPYQKTVTILAKGQIIKEFRPFSLGKDVELGLTTAYFNHYVDYIAFQWFFQGALWVMIAYNFTIFILTYDKAYLYYTLYVLCSSTYTWTQGLFEESFLSLYFPLHKEFVWGLSLSLLPIFYFQFVRHYIRLKELRPVYNLLIFRYVQFRILYSIGHGIGLFLSEDLSFFANMINVILVLDIILGIIFCFLSYRINKDLGIFLVVGISLLLLTSLLTMAWIYKLFYNPLGFNTLKLGILSEVVFFSLGLGYRGRKNEIEKRLAQEKLLEQLKKNELLQHKVNRELEQKVLERTLEIHNQKSIIEEKNKALIDSIQYAQKIQDAILPSAKIIDKLLPEHFILFMPKDIVSGDFFWVEEQQEKIIIASADCTGHGVPGALMSMLGHEVLNEIILQQHVTSPETILEKMHKRIRYLLKQEATNNNDGMDIGLVVIDKNRKILEYAGAGSPLYLIQNQVLTQIKGDILSVGGSQFKCNQIFTKHNIPIDIPTTFYIGSDGFQDQFGGANNKKFTTRAFRELLLKINGLAMPEQKEILKQKIITWKNEAKTTQTDDILIIGVHLH